VIAPGAGAADEAGDPPVYVEPARSYTTARALFVLLVAGFGLDLVLGGGWSHGWAWLLAVVLVVGIDVLATRAARAMRSITVTATEVRVGEHALPRARIAGLRPGAEADPTRPVLGQSVREGLPRSVPGLALQLIDGEVLLVPTRQPERLAAALGLDVDHATEHGAAAAEAAEAVEAVEVRAAEADDLALLDEIDTRAESLFRVSGLDLPDIAFPTEHLADAKAILVVGRPAVGFIWIDEVDGVAHVEELAVLPGHMRAGLGSALLAAACEWAAAGYSAITLSTYRDVAWNAPFYSRRGFVALDPDELTPELAAVREWERAAGLDDVGPRLAMRRELQT
jgi:ribosomal protein S18 acetylase RimI-like enzyme